MSELTGRQRQIARELNPVKVQGFIVEGDGTPQGTRVYFEGEEVTGITHVSWDIGVGSSPSLTLSVTGPPERRRRP